jgi:hypothetical protein
MFVLLFLTPVFEKLPYNTMAAIIIVGVAGLVEFEEAIYLFKVGEVRGWVSGGGGRGQGLQQEGKQLMPRAVLQ